MGAGSDLAGAGRAGEDLPIPGGPNAALPTSAAFEFDGTTLDYALDDHGRIKTAHWVDQAVFTLLRIRQGSIRSAPDVGETVSKIKTIDRVRVQSQVEDRVKLALFSLTNRALIRILSITVDSSVQGRIQYLCAYQNLMTGKPEKATGAI
jgi:hypothetical protein